MSAQPMRHDASTNAIFRNPACGYSFKPRKSWQVYCSDGCRSAHHATQGDGGLRAQVKSNKLLKGGKRSVTLHFEPGEDVERLEPGRVVEIV